MTYKVAEKFKSVQGEGMYAGTPMAFIRFVGCSVGKRICQHCDTDFDTTMSWRGGGEFDADELLLWARPYRHICFTGGEPLNQNLLSFVQNWAGIGRRGMMGGGFTIPMLHVETSGTVDVKAVQMLGLPLHLCVSPKPGWLEDSIVQADEIKIIVPGLGDKLPGAPLNGTQNPETGAWDVEKGNWRWPTLQDAIYWADEFPSKPIFLQPRNGKFDLDKNNLVIVQDLIRDHPQLRLSVQMHKVLHVQ